MFSALNELWRRESISLARLSLSLQRLRELYDLIARSGPYEDLSANIDRVRWKY